MNKGNILRLVRVVKNISLRNIAAMVGVSFSAVAQVERGLPSLSESKISEIAKIYGVKSIENDKVIFYPEMLHICYIPVSYRIVQWDFFYSFLSLITAVEMVFFTKKKHLFAIAAKDINNCIFFFLPRSGEKLGKISNIDLIVEKTGIKKYITKIIEFKETVMYHLM
jgi:transcriptional regulator with XRE-family HTH domain